MIDLGVVSVHWRPSAIRGGGMCEGFTDSSGDRRRRSIVLAPVKVRVDGGGFTLTWTCNLAENCHNKECFYAKSKMAE